MQFTHREKDTNNAQKIVKKKIGAAYFVIGIFSSLCLPRMKEEIQELDILINHAEGKLQRAIKAGEPTGELVKMIKSLKEKRATLLESSTKKVK